MKHFDIHLPRKFQQYRINGGLWRSIKKHSGILLQEGDNFQYREGVNGANPRLIDLRNKKV